MKPRSKRLLRGFFSFMGLQVKHNQIGLNEFWLIGEQVQIILRYKPFALRVGLGFSG